MIGTSLQNLFTSLPTYVYFLIGRILTVHYRSFVTINYRQSMLELDQFNRSYYFLNRKFGLILLVVVVYNFILTITASYFLIRSLISNQAVFILWDSFQIVENLTKIVFICYTAERQIESAVISIYISIKYDKPFNARFF